MKIGMMVDTYKPYVSGVTTQVELLQHALEKLGCEVYIFTFGDTSYQDKETRVIHSPGLALADTGFYLSLRYRAAARRLLQSMDIVHVHHPFLSGRLAIRYLRRKQIPIVFTNHTRYEIYPQTYLPIIPEEVGQNLLRAYMPDFCAATDLVTTPSESMKLILQNLNVTRHIEVVANGVDLRQFQQAKPIKRSTLGIAKDDTVLIYTGRLAPEKKILFLLQAFAGVADILPTVHLLLVGGGLKPYEDELFSLITELGISQRTHCTGKVSHEHIPAYLAMSNIYMITSTAESFGISTVEAMATGLPVMGIRATGTSDIVEEGKTGLLSADDLAAYTAKLTYLCLNKDMQKKMGKAARVASEQFAIENTARTLLKFYNRLLEKTRPIRPSLEERLQVILKEFLP